VKGRSFIGERTWKSSASHKKEKGDSVHEGERPLGKSGLEDSVRQGGRPSSEEETGRGEEGKEIQPSLRRPAGKVSYGAFLQEEKIPTGRGGERRDTRAGLKGREKKDHSEGKKKEKTLLAPFRLRKETGC